MIKKLNLSHAVSSEIYDLVNTVNKLFVPLENISKDHTWWSIDRTKSCQVKQIGSYEFENLEFFDVEICNIEYIENNFKDLQPFFKKYKLYDFIGSALEQNFQIHKHIYSAGSSISCYTIAVFNDYGTFDIVEPIDYIDSNFYFDKPKITYFSRLPKDVNYKKIFSSETKPGDIYCFNTWLWHTFTTVDKPRTHVFYVKDMQTEEEFNEYVKYIEAL